MWVRSIEFVCPNVVQLCRIPHFPLDQSNAEETEYDVVATRWRVPVDDTNTVEFAFVYSNVDETEAYFDFDQPWPADLSNVAGRAYEESQRVPGDFEAQTGQRPIAIHATEHLATSDRGVAMLRRMVREGIETVQRGDDPPGITRDGAALPIFARETVKRAPPAATRAVPPIYSIYRRNLGILHHHRIPFPACIRSSKSSRTARRSTQKSLPCDSR